MRRGLGAICFLLVFALVHMAPELASVRANVQQSAEEPVATLLFSRLGSERGVHIVHSDGSGLRKVSHKKYPTRFSRPGTYQAKWSPNGRRIAFAARHRRLTNVLMVVRPDGSGQRRLTDGTRLAGQYGPSWSPSGRALTYMHDDQEMTSVYRMRIDGTSRVRLVRRPSFDPAWSPSGGTIAFVGLARRYRNQIFVMNADGTDKRQLTDSSGKGLYEPDNEDLAWSPDGTKIAFVSENDGNREIYVMDADGTSQRRLTTSPADDFDPAWAPSGDRIAFVSLRDGNREIYTVGIDGGDETRVTELSTNESDPVWSPDGSLIAFVRSEERYRHIYVIAPDGSDLRQVTSGTHRDLDPEWKPDR